MKVPTEEIGEILNQLPVKRLRVEAVLDELFENGLCEPGDVVIAPESSSSFYYERDVTNLEEIFNPLNGRSWYRLNTPRDGFFDSLPERLFHKPAGRLKNNDEWAEIRSDEMQQEADARMFFLPFDSSMAQQRVRIERFERRALEGRETGFLKEFLRLFWPETQSLDLSDEQQRNLFQLTIMAHQVAGDLEQTQHCFESMLGVPVRLSYENVVYNVPVSGSFPALGEEILGVDKIVATSSFAKWRRLRIDVGPLFYEDMRDFFPARKGEKLLQFLCDLLVPAEIDWYVDLIAATGDVVLENEEKTAVSFTIHNGSERFAVLGYTTVL